MIDGLVYGEDPRGMVAALAALVRRLPIIPLVVGGRQTLFAVHEEDLSNVVLRMSEKPPGSFSLPVTAASPEGLTLHEILNALAAAQDRTIRFVRVPFAFVHAVLRTAEFLGVKMRTTSDSLVSLVNQNDKPDCRGRTRPW